MVPTHWSDRLQATGNFGPSIVSALVTAGFTVTALSRSGSTSKLPSEVKVVEVNYDSHDSLVTALKGQDVFISAVPNHGDQPKLIDAAIAAGVKRFLPSEFGSDIAGNENVQKLPVFQGKLKTQKYLEEKKDQISYTIVVNGAFLDWGIKVGFIINKNTTRVFNGGDKPRSTTTLEDIGKGVVGVLRHPEETKNRAVYLQSAAVSQNKLLELAKKKNPDFKPEIQNVDTLKVLQDSYDALEKNDADVGTALRGFIVVSIYTEGYGGLFAKNDNELLGIKGKSDEELEALVAQYV